MQNKFEELSTKASKLVGSPLWFTTSVLLIVIWFPSGLFRNFDEFWHLTINTITTILTFLMMSLLHASQSKWEKQMETMETRQQKLLELLDLETKEILKENEQLRPKG